MIACPRRRVLQLSLGTSMKGYARQQIRREGEREQRRLKLNALAAHTNQTIARDSCMSYKAGCE